jgi:hypothetical protein
MMKVKADLISIVYLSECKIKVELQIDGHDSPPICIHRALKADFDAKLEALIRTETEPYADHPLQDDPCILELYDQFAD